MQTDFQVGDRVRLSELGRKGAKQPDRSGVIVAISRSGTQCTVIWEGVRAPQVFYFTLLEHAPDEAAPSPCTKGGPVA
jgi:hypothetical protein